MLWQHSHPSLSCAPSAPPPPSVNPRTAQSQNPIPHKLPSASPSALPFPFASIARGPARSPRDALARRERVDAPRERDLTDSDASEREGARRGVTTAPWLVCSGPHPASSSSAAGKVQSWYGWSGPHPLSSRSGERARQSALHCLKTHLSSRGARSGFSPAPHSRPRASPPRARSTPAHPPPPAPYEARPASVDPAVGSQATLKPLAPLPLSSQHPAPGAA